MKNELGDIDLKKVKQGTKNQEHDGEPNKPEYDAQNAPVVQPIPDGARTSTEGFELPTGYLDDEGKLHKDIFVKEITGVEEDILTSKKTPVHMRFTKILENCIVSIGPFKQGSNEWPYIIKRLVASDRLYALLKIRIVSLGPLFSFKVKCANEDCQKLSNQTVSLEDFKVKGMVDPQQRSWKGVLPKSRLPYIAKVQTGNEEAKLSQAASSADMMSLAILGRLVELNGKQPVSLDAVKSLSMMDRQHLRNEFNEREGDIENEVEVTCPYCAFEFETQIDIADPHFFFPSATSKR